MQIFEPQVRHRGFLPEPGASDSDAETEVEDHWTHRPGRHGRLLASSAPRKRGKTSGRSAARPLAKSATATGSRRPSHTHR